MCLEFVLSVEGLEHTKQNTCSLEASTEDCRTMQCTNGILFPGFPVGYVSVPRSMAEYEWKTFSTAPRSPDFCSRIFSSKGAPDVGSVSWANQADTWSLEKAAWWTWCDFFFCF